MPPLDQEHEHAVSADRDPGTMPLGDHLEELRGRLFKALLAVGLAAGLALLFGQHLVGWLVQPLNRALADQGQPALTYALGVTTGFAVYLKVSLVTGVIAGAPVAVYQLWRFVEAGLYSHERRFVMLVTPFSAGLSVLAVVFVYYVMLPVCLAFLIGFTAGFPDWSSPSSAENGSVAATQPEAQGLAQLPVLERDPVDPPTGSAWIIGQHAELRVALEGQTYRFMGIRGGSGIVPRIDVKQYIAFVTLLGLGALVAFQLPVVMLLLGSTGLIDPDWLRRYRRHGMLGAFALSALLTPGDVASMFVLAVPLYLLFELGLVVMTWAYRRQEGDPEEQAGPAV